MSFDKFFGHDIDFDLAMKPFSWQHFGLMFLGVISVVLILKYANSIKKLRFEKKIKIAFVIWLILLELAYHIHYWAYGLFSVPLHVCSFGVLFSVILLLTNKYKVFELLFFFGIFGGLLALFLPNTLGYTYYNFRYYHFIVLHMSIAIVPLYYYKAYGYRVKVTSVYKTFGLLLLLLPLVVYVNYTFDKNYMFIGEKPEIVAAFFPKWPYYVIVFAILGFGLSYLSVSISNFDDSRFKLKK